MSSIRKNSKVTQFNRNICKVSNLLCLINFNNRYILYMLFHYLYVLTCTIHQKSLMPRSFCCVTGLPAVCLSPKASFSLLSEIPSERDFHIPTNNLFRSLTALVVNYRFFQSTNHSVTKFFTLLSYVSMALFYVYVLWHFMAFILCLYFFCFRSSHVVVALNILNNIKNLKHFQNGVCFAKEIHLCVQE